MNQILSLFTKDKNRTQHTSLIMAALLYLGWQGDKAATEIAAVKTQVARCEATIQTLAQHAGIQSTNRFASR